MIHLFEFMDLEFLPGSMRDTMREALEASNQRPFMRYYDWVANRTMAIAKEHNLTTVVELGAGAAPIAKRVAKNADQYGIKNIIVCDLNPDHESWTGLTKKFPGLINPVFERVDFSENHPWPDKSLLVLVSTLHHLPSEKRQLLVAHLSNSADGCLIFEPLKRNLISILFCCFGVIPALLLPLLNLNKPRFFRQAFWCWLFPVVPFLYSFDGIVSCLRMWNVKQWQNALAGTNRKHEMDYKRHIFYHSVTLV